MKDLGLTDSDLGTMVLDESKRQIEKWGFQDHKSPVWMLILNEEVGELNKAILERYVSDEPNVEEINSIIKEAIQVSTLSLKIAEMFLMIKAG